MRFLKNPNPVPRILRASLGVQRAPHVLLYPETEPWRVEEQTAVANNTLRFPASPRPHQPTRRCMPGVLLRLDEGKQALSCARTLKKDPKGIRFKQNIYFTACISSTFACISAPKRV